jgi:hypothetical protein
MALRKSLIYLLIFTTVGAFFTYKIIVSAYQDTGMYDIENLKS